MDFSYSYESPDIEMKLEMSLVELDEKGCFNISFRKNTHNNKSVLEGVGPIILFPWNK